MWITPKLNTSIVIETCFYFDKKCKLQPSLTHWPSLELSVECSERKFINEMSLTNPLEKGSSPREWEKENHQLGYYWLTRSSQIPQPAIVLKMRRGKRSWLRVCARIIKIIKLAPESFDLIAFVNNLALQYDKINSKLISIFCPRAKIRHFSKELLFLLMRNDI